MSSGEVKGQQFGTMDYCPVTEQVFSSLCMDFLGLPLVADQDKRQFDSVFVVVAI